jgi:hypothetical protein
MQKATDEEQPEPVLISAEREDELIAAAVRGAMAALQAALDIIEKRHESKAVD